MSLFSMAADYDYDMDGEDDIIGILMEYSDAELARYAEKADDEKIVSIREQALRGRVLSEKQRYCLAFWIESNYDGGALGPKENCE